MIDCLVFKPESYDLEAFKKRLYQYSPYCAMLVYNYRGGVVAGGKQIFKYTPHFIINLISVFFILLFYCVKYRPRVMIIENTYDAAMIGILRKIGFVKKMVYVCGDWLLNPLFPYLDFLACQYADVVWDVSDRVKQERILFWKRDITKKEFAYMYYCDKKTVDTSKPRTKIVFLGQNRPDSGLDIAQANKHFPVKILPFVKREDFAEHFSDCFCGINLITSQGSYTTRTIPSKVMEYLQHGLPAIVTKNCGLIAEIVERNGLGRVIDANTEAFHGAAWDLFHHQEYYQKKIAIFLDSIKPPTLGEIIDGMAR
jgi:hypothetical protein